MRAGRAFRWLYFLLAILLGGIGIPLALFSAAALYFEAASLLRGEAVSAKEGFGLVLLLASYFLLKWMVEAWLRFRSQAPLRDLPRERDLVLPKAHRDRNDVV